MAMIKERDHLKDKNVVNFKLHLFIDVEVNLRV